MKYNLPEKVEQIKKLLADTELSIEEICYEAEFENRSHMSTTFKKATGVTPSRFRKMSREGRIRPDGSVAPAGK
jgi:AraC-like DNA-binding protein